MKRLICTGLLLTAAAVVFQPSAQAQRKQEKNNPPKVSLSVGKLAGEFGNVEGITAEQLKQFLTFIAADELRDETHLRVGWT